MKKFILFSLFALTMFTAMIPNEAKAQSSFRFARTTTNSTSRFFNTTPDTVTLYLPGYYKTIAFQPVVSKDSGTVNGTVIIYGSIDGVNFVTTGDTLSLTNTTTQTTIFKHSDPVWVYFRGIALGSGTQAGKLQIYYTARKEP